MIETNICMYMYFHLLQKMTCAVPPPASTVGTASPALSMASSLSTLNLDTDISNEPVLKLSLDDIHRTLEYERSRSQQQSRCEAIKSAHTRMLKIYARARYDRHGPTESMSLPSFSRPQTGISRESTRARSAVTLPAPPSALRTTRLCIRVQSALNDDLEPAVSSLCRQCCEILGPQSCHQCGRIQRRQRDMRRYEHTFPCLRQGDTDFSTSVVVKKCMPLMETDHIENLVAHGSISKPNFKETLQRLKAEALMNEEEAEAKRRASHKAAVKGRGTYTFFSGIRDLNQKIVSGSVSKKKSGQWGIKLTKDPSGKPIANENTSFTELLCPMFISPKRLKDVRPAFLAMYEPPLLPKASQNVDPAFFAGSEVAYKLPDRLPDQLIDCDESV